MGRTGDKKRRSNERQTEETRSLIQAVAIGGVVALTILDQVVEPTIDVPSEVTWSLIALYVGASKIVRRALERAFGGNGK